MRVFHYCLILDVWRIRTYLSHLWRICSNFSRVTVTCEFCTRVTDSFECESQTNLSQVWKIRTYLLHRANLSLLSLHICCQCCLWHQLHLLSWHYSCCQGCLWYELHLVSWHYSCCQGCLWYELHLLSWHYTWCQSCFWYEFHLLSWHTRDDRKVRFFFLIQRKVRILSKFCDAHIEIKCISSNWMLFGKQLWRHSLWHVTSRDIPEGVIVVNRFSRVASEKFEIFFRSKKHSIPLKYAHLKVIATDPNTI